jgi:alpha-beta hydrolase superfamily lysophospholipase
MLGELVMVMTEDRVRLDGFYCQPSDQPPEFLHPASDAGLPIDGVVIVHGLSGNFYSSKLLKHLSHQMLKHGLKTVVVNTRGHDYLNSTVRMGRAQTIGAAVEVVDEAKFDLFAWVEFLVNRGCERVMLLGHSLGAIKSLYAQAYRPHPRTAALAGLSATRLSYDELLGSEGGGKFSKCLQRARDLIAQDQGDQLFYADFPFPTWMSATAYIGKYADGDKYNWLSFADRITIPTLVIFGQIEMQENPAFMGMQADLSRLTGAHPNFRVQILESADHFYSARVLAASKLIIDWLKGLTFPN